MSIFNVFTLLGGLALFLYGMNVMGNALEKQAGNRLNSILEKLTASPLKGFLLGLIVTAIIQSSSATTVMVVGFVNSGIMRLNQAIGIIMGSNVGTTVTSWILSLTGLEGDNMIVQLFKPSTFAPILAFIGIVMQMAFKDEKKRNVGNILLGFTVLMTGMDLMSGAVKPLANVPAFTNLFVKFSNPILGMLVGALLTGIIQSSSASVGILQALSMTGSVPYSVCIPVILGQNIGTCITAVLSSLGTSKDARRASMIHLYFNVIGVVVWMSVFYILNAIFGFAFVSMAANPLGIAIVHSVFKLLSTILLMPAGSLLEKLARLTIPDGKEKDEIALLDERLFVTPSIALERTHNVLLEMAELSFDALYTSLDLLDSYDDKKVVDVVDAEGRVDVYEDKIGTYLVKLTSRSMSEQDSHELTKYLHIIGDLERLSDHAVNLMESAQEIHDKQLAFGAEVDHELTTIKRAVRAILKDSREALRTDNLEIASHVEPLEQVIDLLNKTIRSRQTSRLSRAETTMEMGFVLNDILTNLERVSDHCSNIAVCIIEIAHNSFDTHEYLNEMKVGSGEFLRRYDELKREYALNEPA